LIGRIALGSGYELHPRGADPSGSPQRPAERVRCSADDFVALARSSTHVDPLLEHRLRTVLGEHHLVTVAWMSSESVLFALGRLVERGSFELRRIALPRSPAPRVRPSIRSRAAGLWCSTSRTQQAGTMLLAGTFHDGGSMSTQLSREMVLHYLSSVTAGWFDHNDLPPDDVREYLPRVEEMKRHATRHADLENLRLAIEYLLTAPHLDLEHFAGPRYPYDADEVREIIEFAYKKIWPERTLPTEAPAVDLVPIPVDEWWRRGSRADPEP